MTQSTKPRSKLSPKISAPSVSLHPSPRPRPAAPLAIYPLSSTGISGKESELSEHLQLRVVHTFKD